MVGTGPGNKPGLTWKSKYGAVGLDCYGMVTFADGMNEKGLASGVFYLPGFAQYQKVGPGEQGKSLAPWEIPLWVLTSFATVDEVKAAITKIKVWPGVVPNLSKEPLPLHYIVTDQSGRSLVIEYVKGKLHLYDNPLGVITNSPPFDWQLKNNVARSGPGRADIVTPGLASKTSARHPRILLLIAISKRPAGSAPRDTKRLLKLRYLKYSNT